jgi:sugar phosphate isomerase/epimerase
MVKDGLLNVSDEALEVLNAVKNLYMTIDLNHALYENVANYIRKVGPRVKNVHVSDRDEITERHWLPKKGILDFNDIMLALQEIDYTGALTYEVSVRPGNYTVEEVKKNYDEITSVFNK